MPGCKWIVHSGVRTLILVAEQMKGRCVLCHRNPAHFRCKCRSVRLLSRSSSVPQLLRAPQCPCAALPSDQVVVTGTTFVPTPRNPLDCSLLVKLYQLTLKLLNIKLSWYACMIVIWCKTTVSCALSLGIWALSFTGVCCTYPTAQDQAHLCFKMYFTSAIRDVLGNKLEDWVVCHRLRWS